MSDRRVRIIRPWQYYRIGQMLEPPGTLRQWLIEHKFAEPYTKAMEAVEATIETTSMEAAPEKAVLPQPVRRKRGRPRKHPIEQGT